MKILLFITGHRHVEEYLYFNRFLQRLNKLPRICDIFIHCNNPLVSSKVFEYFQLFTQKNKHILFTSKNGGYAVGGLEAVSEMYDKCIFNEYDYVIHIHPDVFITDDTYLFEELENNLYNDIAFLITKSVPNDNTFFSFDFFIFKPKYVATNIFKEDLYSFTCAVENRLHEIIIKNNLKYKFIKRYNNDHYLPRRVDENLGLYHEHEIEKVYALWNMIELYDNTIRKNT